MSIRGLLVALLCGLVGLGGGAAVAYAVQPSATVAGQATPVAAYSPSVPIDPPSQTPYAPDIDYPTLGTDLSLPTPHQVKNKLATWSYHVPFGWTAYSVPADTVVPPGRVDRLKQVRFRPPDEPPVGGYSLRVEILDNQLGNNVSQLVGDKIIGFEQAYTDFHILKRTTSAVYFTYRDENNHLRYNFFQWFAVDRSAFTPGTLEMSVSGRKADAPGLRALINRFADNAMGVAGPHS